MKKVFLTVVLCLFTMGPAFAQSNAQAMRFLMVSSMMEYGQRLYDRGDYNGASSVFNHVLAYDAHQPQALEYLKDMGRGSQKPGAALRVSKNTIVIRKSPEQIVNMVDVSDTQSVKRAIEAKKQIIEKLRIQIKQMRASLAAQSAQEELN